MEPKLVHMSLPFIQTTQHPISLRYFFIRYWVRFVETALDFYYNALDYLYLLKHVKLSNANARLRRLQQQRTWQEQREMKGM